MGDDEVSSLLEVPSSSFFGGVDWALGFDAIILSVVFITSLSSSNVLLYFSCDSFKVDFVSFSCRKLKLSLASAAFL